MKKVFRVVLSTLGLAGLGTGVLLSAGGCARSVPVLHVYNWIDYIKPELMQRFEKENGCKIVLDTYDSNEAMYAKLKAGATGYDVAFPSSYMLQVMVKQDMLEKLDHTKLPNLAHIDPWAQEVTKDVRSEYSVPYTISYTGVGYRKSKVKDLVESWSMFDRADLAGRMTMLNDMRETLAGALLFIGYSANTTNDAELAKAVEIVQRWKKNLAKFENEQYKTGLASSEFLLVHGYVGDLLQVQAEDPDIGIYLPKEGFVMTCDCIVIPKGARQLDLAHKFIDFLLDPAVSAENTGFTQYLCPNKDGYALLDEKTRANPAIVLPDEVRKRGEINLDLGEDVAKFIKAWDAIKAGQ